MARYDVLSDAAVDAAVVCRTAACGTSVAQSAQTHAVKPSSRLVIVVERPSLTDLRRSWARRTLRDEVFLRSAPPGKCRYSHKIPPHTPTRSSSSNPQPKSTNFASGQPVLGGHINRSAGGLDGEWHHIAGGRGKSLVGTGLVGCAMMRIPALASPSREVE